LHLSAYGGRNDNLFHAAAAESVSFGRQLNVIESQYQYDALVQRTGCNTTIDTLKCLRNLSTADLQSQNINIPTPDIGGNPPIYMYSVVIDGDLVPDFTYNLYRQGRFINVPTIMG
jgi:carboxylesterase type B